MIKTTKPVKSETPNFPSVAEPRLLAIKDVAERLHVSDRTIRRAIDNGELAVIRIRRSVRVSETALKAFLTGEDKS